MALFTSTRERRLWLTLLIVLLAIYLTLGLAGALAKLLSDREMLTPVFFLGLILTMTAVVTQGLRKRPRGSEIAIILGIVSVFLLLFARMGIPDADRGHLIEYSVVAIIIHEALTERAKQMTYLTDIALKTLIATTLLGFLDECIQAIHPTRVFDAIDLLFNFLAGLMAVSVIEALQWVRTKSKWAN